MQLPHDEKIDILDIKPIAWSTNGFYLSPRIHDVSDVMLVWMSLFPNEIKVNITIDDNRLRWNLTINKTIKFIEKSFRTILGFTQSHSVQLNDQSKGYILTIAGTYKSGKPNNSTGIEKIHLKCDCINGSTVNDTREPILYRFGLYKPPGQTIIKEPRIKHLEKMNNSVFSHISFYLEDDDHKPVDFWRNVSFSCQLITI